MINHGFIHKFGSPSAPVARHASGGSPTEASLPRHGEMAKSLLELKSIELRAGEEYHRSGTYLIIYIYTCIYIYIYYELILYICIYIYHGSGFGFDLISNNKK